jgi:AmpD protein
VKLAAGQDWLEGARHLPSANCDDRPPGTVIDLIVLHGISLPPGEFGGDAIDRLFTNHLDFLEHPYYEKLRSLRVSAHCLVRRDGSITQYVPFSRRAWHAGVSAFEGRPACNDYSIGIELEGADDRAYDSAQYPAAARLCLLLMEAYPAILPWRCVGHCDVAPGRKTDPGPAFDWERFRGLLAGLHGHGSTPPVASREWSTSCTGDLP